MPAPAARYKLLPARGAYASLAAALADIAEGEIVYATDQDLYYQKEGGVLTPVGVPEAPNDGTQYVRQNQSWAAVDVPPGTIVGTSADLPGTIETGQLWYDTDTSRLLVYTGTEWVLASPVASTVAADNPPSNPQDGDLWFDTSDGSGRLYVYYVDADSSQWVDASPDSTGEWLRDDLTSTISTAIAGDSVDIGSSNILLNADGSANFAGNVGIGTTSPASKLHIANSSSAEIELILDPGSGSSETAYINSYRTNSPLGFKVGDTERMRIDSSGRLLVGTSSSIAGSSQLQIEGTGFYESGASLRRNSNDNGGPALRICKSRGTSNGSYSVVSSSDTLGLIMFIGADGSADKAGAEIRCEVDGTPGANDMPGRLVFSTTADGASSPTERMRIGSAGASGIFGTNTDVFSARSNASAGTTYSLYTGYHSGSAPLSGGTLSFNVTTNGDVTNTNNSYGAISDIKLKENIVDASSQWDDLKALQVRNYSFKEGQTHTQIGVVAQEVELVSPGLVTESPDRDEDGNDLGTVTKSVNYSVLYMKAVKALQEAMERIETLEQRLSNAGIA